MLYNHIVTITLAIKSISLSGKKEMFPLGFLIINDYNLYIKICVMIYVAYTIITLMGLVTLNEIIKTIINRK